MSDKLWNDIAKILNLLDRIQNETPEQAEARYRDELARRRQRTANRNARFAAALQHCTDLQAARIAKCEDTGNVVVKLLQNRNNKRIAVMLQRNDTYNEMTGRTGTKLTMVYPDGRYQEAFGKVPVHSDWIK